MKTDTKTSSKLSKGLFLMLFLGFFFCMNFDAQAQKSNTKNNDKQIGKDKEGRMIFEGAKGGKYYLTASGAKSYVNDGKADIKKETKSDVKNNDKQVGKDKEGRMIFEGSRGGKYYLTASGAKSYIK